jgi:hypothetical protein
MSGPSHMKSCPCPACERRRQDRQFRILILVAALVGALAVCFLSSCASTRTPDPVPVRQASFDQGEQSSGVLRLVDGGAIITAHARDRYNALVLTYGREFRPAMTIDYGITTTVDGAIQISNEALQKFILMNAWQRMGRAPAAGISADAPQTLAPGSRSARLAGQQSTATP